MTANNIEELLNLSAHKYLRMEIGGTVVNCPYWMNKMRGGKVILRGFENGKGEAEVIREKIASFFPLGSNPSAENIYKLSKKERIGIDCSGLIYRLLDAVIMKRGIPGIKRLDEIFTGGVDRTNAATLTDLRYCRKISDISDIRVLDLVRMSRGKHILLIYRVIGKRIEYIHSSSKTEQKGVHLGNIELGKTLSGLESQLWNERASNGESYSERYFYPGDGDGLYRLGFL